MKYKCIFKMHRLKILIYIFKNSQILKIMLQIINKNKKMMISKSKFLKESNKKSKIIKLHLNKICIFLILRSSEEEENKIIKIKDV